MKVLKNYFFLFFGIRNLESRKKIVEIEFYFIFFVLRHQILGKEVRKSKNKKVEQNKSSESKVKFRQASNHCKTVLEASKLAYANKTKEYMTSQKLGSLDFWRIANSVLHKDKSAIPPLFSIQRSGAVVFCI